ncbi:MAG: DUF2922 domain-containing protein [Clostridiales bacterium]|nr:DUF2922 domain-containing protein [Clostridiales bacterium]MCF8023172.1 DUF2922 domain-containing protein [Clostridiales bacterium]
MSTSSTKYLRMTFKSQGGNSMSISLDSPRTDLTAAEVETVMDTIISKNVFSATGGDLASKYDVKIIDKTTNDLYDPA